MKKDPELVAEEIFNEYYRWVKVISYTIESEQMLKAIAKDMALICVLNIINSHSSSKEIVYWAKVKNLLNSNLPSSNKHEVKFVKCSCGKDIKVHLNKYDKSNSGKGTCECGAEVSIN